MPGKRIIATLAVALFAAGVASARADTVCPEAKKPASLVHLDALDQLRDALARSGVALELNESTDLLGNISGGIRQGGDFDGALQATIKADARCLLHWDAGTFQFSALWLHGRAISADNLGVIETASGFEAQRAARLWEAWYSRPLADGFDLKIGQQSIDQEFMYADSGPLFVNAMVGWPAVPSTDFYAGGPAYPLSSLGVRLKWNDGGPVTFLMGVFDDNPPGGPFAGDSQLRGAEAYGARFNLGTGALALAELQYALKGERPGVYKFGAWGDMGAFPDQRFDTTGLSLANPLSGGMPRMHRGNGGIYAMADQNVLPDINLAARVVTAPADRNLVSLSVDGSLRVTHPFGRADDVFGIAYGFAQISSRAAALDRDTSTFGGTPYPARSAEQFVEITYQIAVADGWQVQPDFQYFFNPGGGIPNPNLPSKRVRDEAVLGFRTSITF